MQLVLHVLWVIHSAVDKSRVFKSSMGQSKFQLRLPKQFQVAQSDAPAVSKKTKSSDQGANVAVSTDAHLTSKELEVLRLVVDGKKNKEIADVMQISEASVKVHKSRMTSKLGVKTLPELSAALAKFDVSESLSVPTVTDEVSIESNQSNEKNNES